MPFLGGLALLIAVICCFHAVRNDKPNWWLFLLIGMPGIGSAIYFLAVVLPELRQSKKAKLVVADVTKLIDPERDYRQAANDLSFIRWRRRSVPPVHRWLPYHRVSFPSSCPRHRLRSAGSHAYEDERRIA